jgi:hypothetical protein
MLRHTTAVFGVPFTSLYLVLALPGGKQQLVSGRIHDGASGGEFMRASLT